MSDKPLQPSLPYSLPLTVALITNLTLIICLSFKLIALGEVVFSANSILCAFFSALFLMVVRNCNKNEQQQVLNHSLITLYLVSIGLYLLVNLPALENVRNYIAYQIVFEEIPRKFFSVTTAFIISFYLPYTYYVFYKNKTLSTSKQQCIAIIISNSLFFSINFFLLFCDPLIKNCLSLFLTSGVVSLLSLVFLLLVSWILFSSKASRILSGLNWRHRKIAMICSSDYSLLVIIALNILLISLACEYRVISLFDVLIIPASSILMPFAILTNHLVVEVYGAKASYRLLTILIISELAFDLILMLAVALPSPKFMNFNDFYWSIIPRRIPATSLGLIIAFYTNTFLIEKLKMKSLEKYTIFRFCLANVVANTLLTLVNCFILFTGIYSHNRVITLVLSSWLYKIVVSFLCYPLLRLFQHRLERANRLT